LQKVRPLAWRRILALCVAGPIDLAGTFFGSPNISIAQPGWQGRAAAHQGGPEFKALEQRLGFAPAPCSAAGRNGAVTARLPETYRWLLVPEQLTIRDGVAMPA
jgi:hypothetical protein